MVASSSLTRKHTHTQFHASPTWICTQWFFFYGPEYRNFHFPFAIILLKPIVSAFWILILSSCVCRPFWFNCKSEIFAKYRCIFIFYKGCQQDGAGAPSGTGPVPTLMVHQTGWDGAHHYRGWCWDAQCSDALLALGLVTAAAPVQGPLKPQGYKVVTSPLAINF